MNPKAETLYDLLLDAKTKNSGQLNRELWLKVTQDFLDEHEAAKVTRPRQVATSTQAALSDGEWIAYLEQLPHLQGIDIKREIGKCQLWTTTNKGVPPTRKRICLLYTSPSPRDS